MRNVLGLFAVALLAACATAGDQKCSLLRVAEMPVTMVGTEPMLDGTINGEPARFLADSGAFFSLLSPESAERYGLRSRPLPQGFAVQGVGGLERMKLARVAELTLEGYAAGLPLPNADFLVRSRPLQGYDGIIGQNILGSADTEYDLANGVIRVFRSEGCKGPRLAYWAADAPIAELAFRRRTAAQPLMIARAKLNGKGIRVILDTGASRSFLTAGAAARAGIAREDEGVAAVGLATGIGRRRLETSVARFDVLDLGGEVIRNAQLHMADLSLGSADMLLGADFFLSHRIYVDSRADKIYFTYNGGPVFDLSRDVEATALRDELRDLLDAAAPDVGGSPDAETPPSRPDASPSGSVQDAADLRRRSAASAGRGDIEGALADLDRAVDLDPTSSEGYYQRALLHSESRRAESALADVDLALELEPDSVRALMLRGAVRLQLADDAGASEDFAAAQRLAPDDARLPLDAARALGSAGKAREAIAQLDGWLARYPDDARVPDVLHGRCRLRGGANFELDLALADCDAALDKGARSSLAYRRRALVHLRLGNYDEASADYDAALKRQPRDAVALYGRGLTALRQGLNTEGQRDLAAARAIDATVAVQFRAMGLEE